MIEATATEFCSACQGTLDADDSSYHCAGSCNNVFHGKCLGLTPAIRKEVLRNPQLQWVCAGCSVTTGIGAARMKNVLLSELSPLLDQMRNNILAEFDRRFSHLLELSRSPVAKGDRETGASLASATTNTTYADVTKEHMLPHQRQKPTAAPSNPPLVTGTAPKVLVKTVPTLQPKLWLFFSRLTTDTTDEQITDMVRQCLGDTEVIVRRLLARDRDVTSVPFLSFKVGVPCALRLKALDPATWPHGVCFREFVDRPRHVNPQQKLTSLAAELALSPHILANLSTPSPPHCTLASVRHDDNSFVTPSQLRKRPRADNGSASKDD
ncbi:uncharacterized protein LOC118468183 [Anopheles albimanus]|uniref:uncharacterized protein LOC118468183 n=1 Tax=Anopheles albimanus TaxID=7167 RepID=UPI00163F1474|nr:uncharacterized protein LOC118468183 [Anopheles albimanus]